MPALEALKEKGKVPTEISDEDVFVLTEEMLRPVEVISARSSLPEDIDEWIRLDRIVGGRDPSSPITDTERARVFPKHAAVLYEGNKMVAKANLHAVTDHYAQVGGVATHPEYRRRGYSKQCMTQLCRNCFAAGISNVLLFTDKTNVAAQKVYRDLGFTPVDEFVLADY